jgi:hypothetical protein
MTRPAAPTASLPLLAPATGSILSTVFRGTSRPRQPSAPARVNALRRRPARRQVPGKHHHELGRRQRDLGGFFDRTFAPRAVERLYSEALDRLNAYATEHRTA